MERVIDIVSRTDLGGADGQQTQTAPVPYSAISSLDAELRACEYDLRVRANDSQGLAARIPPSPRPYREATSRRHHPSPCRKSYH
jgi:hypothetical protein